MQSLCHANITLHLKQVLLWQAWRAPGCTAGSSRRRCPGQTPFSGLYLGSFGPHGPEILQLKRSVTEASL